MADLFRHTTFDDGPTRSCAARGGRKFTPGREISVSFLSPLYTDVHLVGGDPQDAEFCDGPGPGMALEQNSFPAAAPTGRVGLVLLKVGWIMLWRGFLSTNGGSKGTGRALSSPLWGVGGA